MSSGVVYLVGAGPGDPGLITVKGLFCIQQADVIIYDRLVNHRLLAQARPGCELIARNELGHDQDDLCSLMIERAREGKTVVRLKGGDPFLFGRGGEEAERLSAAGVPFEVVPGVTSALAVPAYAGIPLTYRGLSSSVGIVTGHEAPSKLNEAVHWDLLAHAVDTLVILMGLGNLPFIVERLLKAGKSPHTPVAVIGQGSLPEQVVLVSTLAQVVQDVQARQPRPPAVILVGEVARLRKSIGWFERFSPAAHKMEHTPDLPWQDPSQETVPASAPAQSSVAQKPPRMGVTPESAELPQGLSWPKGRSSNILELARLSWTSHIPLAAYNESVSAACSGRGIVPAIRVVLADDHAVVRKGIREFLEEDGDIVVAAEAADGEEAKALIAQHQPDVAILDIRMPKATGIEVTRWVRGQQLAVGVLILTAYDDDPFVLAALQAGANGYVLKTAEADEIVAAVRAVYKGQSALDSVIAQKLMAHLAGTVQPVETVETLTPRELEVLELVARGLTNRSIGRMLSISDRTVQWHLANIFAKLQVNSRTEAVTKGLQLGLIHLPKEMP